MHPTLPTLPTQTSIQNRSMTKSEHYRTKTEDLILGAPGYGKEGQAQTGRVYVIYGTNQVLHNGSHDLDKEADVILQGFHVSCFVFVWCKVYISFN